MKKWAVLCMAAIAAAGTFVAVSASQAATTGVDLSMTGAVVAGVTAAQADQSLAFSFTIANRSATTAADISFDFSTVNGTADGSDFICPLVSTHFNINPDTPSCEVGFLAAGKKSAAAILVTPTILSGTMSVTACASNLTGARDPVTSNNCKTITIPIL